MGVTSTSTPPPLSASLISSATISAVPVMVPTRMERFTAKRPSKKRRSRSLPRVRSVIARRHRRQPDSPPNPRRAGYRHAGHRMTAKVIVPKILADKHYNAYSWGQDAPAPRGDPEASDHGREARGARGSG